MPYRILFMTDIHFRATKPVSRLDADFFATILGKIDEIREMAEHVDLVLMGGDIFDRPDTPHSVVIRVNRAFSRFSCPIYTVIGNHDIFGYEGQTVDATAMGSLLEMGRVKRLNFIEVGGAGRPRIQIFGMHAFDKEEWRVPDSGATKVLVSHKLITTIPIPSCKTFLVNDVAPLTNADVVLSGDVHFPHMVEVGGKLFVNPGSLSRLSIEDRERTPQVAVLTFEDDGSVSCDFKTVSTRPAECVFDLKAYSNRMASESHTEEFVRTYVSAVISVKGEVGTIDDKFVQFIEKNGPPERIRKMALDFLGRAHTDVLKEMPE